MRTFPIMLNLDGRRVVVVGGGPVGLRKARSLKRTGAKIALVIGHDGAARGRKPAPVGVEVIAEAYRPGLLAGATLVFACTNDRALNSEIAADARKIGSLVNVADQVEDCDFFMPAVARDGDVVLAVGTGGMAPALAVALKDKLTNALPSRVGRLAVLLGQLREKLKSQLPSGARRGWIMKQLTGRRAIEAFQTGGAKAIRKMFDKLTAGL